MKENFASEKLLIDLGQAPQDVILDEIKNAEDIKKQFDETARVNDIMQMWEWV